MMTVFLLRAASAALAVWMDRAARAVLLVAIGVTALLCARAWWLNDGMQRAELAARAAHAAAQIEATRERERIEQAIAAQRERDEAELAEARRIEQAAREQDEREAKKNDKPVPNSAVGVLGLDAGWLRRELARSGSGPGGR